MTHNVTGALVHLQGFIAHVVRTRTDLTPQAIDH